MQLVLSLMPGIDLMGMAFKAEGFSVVQGGDIIFGGDVRTEHYPPGRFDGVIGGPPCQMFSRLAAMVRANGHEPKFGNLIPEFERCVFESQPAWFLMEEVPDAPLPVVDGYAVWSTLLNNRQCYAENGKPAEQNRVLRWSFGVRGNTPRVLMIETAALANPIFKYAATRAARDDIPAGGGSKKVGRNPAKDCLSHGTQRSAKGFATSKRLQGLPDDFDLPGFTVEAKVKAVANGVPWPMARALARAVLEATEAADGREA